MGSSLNEVNRSDFPDGFIFGAATSAYQVEGAWNEGGKGRSNWDCMTLHEPDSIADGKNGCVALDHYNMFKEDVALIKKVGLNSYRFSLAWSRILPGGKLSGGVSKEGIKHYNDLIDALLAQGIEPCATIFHWDVPQCLEDEYGGFLDHQIVQHFCEFADVCFWEFGDRVKRWITLNEPWAFSYAGYVRANFHPRRGKPRPTTSENVTRDQDGATLMKHVMSLLGETCDQDELFCMDPVVGDPGTEPYTVAHNLILAHAHAVNIYRKYYQEHQGGKIGMTNVSAWYYPLRNIQEDVDAASRAVDFMLGWFVAPLVTGDYPLSMRENVGKKRLPEFKPEEKMLVKNSFDFLGINYYTSYYAKNIPKKTCSRSHYDNDRHVENNTHCNGKPIGERGGSTWLYIVPKGLYDLMLHIKERYNNREIFITENGVDEVYNKPKTVAKARIDETRIKYHRDHLTYLKKAIDDGVHVKGYFIWSLADSFEWVGGYNSRFGIFYVDYENGRLTRFPKSSARWWRNFLNKPKVPLTQDVKPKEEGRGNVKRMRP